VAQDKIKRAITWIRKSLEITERTTNPGTIGGEIQPQLDVFGWERIEEATTSIASATATDRATLVAVPEGFLRLVLDASAETDDTVQAFTLWMDVLDGDSGGVTGLMRPVDVPISGTSIRAGLEKTLIMKPGDTLRARCSPDTGVGLVIIARQRFVDLPIGEYIRGF